MHCAWFRNVAIVIASTTLGLPTSSQAACVCACVDGKVKALCTSSLDLEPICQPQLCPLTPPSIEPLRTPTLPPLGTKSCSQKQVLNSGTGQYEWRTVCQ
jgi:hypothetical protein